MHCKVFILVCIVAAAMAYPYPDAVEPYRLAADNGEASRPNAPIFRDRRAAQGGYQIWGSDDGRHEIKVYGPPSFERPNGNQGPNWGAGIGYTFHF